MINIVQTNICKLKHDGVIKQANNVTIIKTIINQNCKYCLCSKKINNHCNNKQQWQLFPT